MDCAQTIPGRIAIGVHPQLAEAAVEAETITRFLQQRGVEAFWGRLYDDSFRQRLETETDLCIALGGDGTMLRVGHLCAPLHIPILGINLGRFGFLTEIKRNEWPEVLPQLLAGNYWLENRMMLQATHLRGDQALGSWSVLNEVVVCRGQFVRPVTLRARVDGYPLASYIADGLIVATPTGSTAYALAVGGPIMPPELRNILIVAVAPHLSIDRAIILSEGAVVNVQVRTSHQAVFSVDGQSPVTMVDGDEVRVEANHNTACFVRFHDRGYFYRNITNYMEQNPAAGEIE
jgi:NAD+ kinase